MEPIYIKLNPLIAAAVSLLIALYIILGEPFPNKGTRKTRKKCTTISGLTNIGNTCFLNCILQALASCSSFLRWLRILTQHSPPLLLKSLEKIIGILNEQTESKTTNPYEILRALQCHGWVISTEEQDAHELFHVLTSTLHDEILLVKRQSHSLFNVSWVSSEIFIPEHVSFYETKNMIKYDSTQKNGSESYLSADPQIQKVPKNCQTSLVISKLSLNDDCSSISWTDGYSILPECPFKGHLASQLQCSICGFKNVTHWSTFNSLSLFLPSSPSSQQNFTLNGLLDAFVLPEKIADVNCNGCSKTGSIPSHTTFLKKLSIGKLPECLCIHIQRSVWLQNGGATKRKEHVSFPEFLNMGPYTYTVSINQQKNLTINSLENFEPSMKFPILYQNPNEELKSTLNNHRNQKIGVSLYKLQAVVVHIGRTYSGHFATYRREITTNKHNLAARWFYTSDLLVKEVPFKEVMSCDAYMVLYERLSTRD